MATEQTDRYAPLGATGKDEGLYVRFEPGFGLNVVVGLRSRGHDGKVREWPDSLVRMSIVGWERLGGLVDQWRERNAGNTSC